MFLSIRKKFRKYWNVCGWSGGWMCLGEMKRGGMGGGEFGKVVGPISRLVGDKLSVILPQ
jgi:hypothetical protein